MKKNQRKILVIILILIFIVIYCYFFETKHKENKIISGQKISEQVQIKTEINIPNLQKVSSDNKELQKENRVSLVVNDKTYNVSISEGYSVYDVMNNLQKSGENNFSFKAKEYPGLGIFVDEINGIKGTLGKYWIYYVNNKEASVSISKYVLNDGDIINWKQE